MIEREKQDAAAIAKAIDHTLLKPDAIEDEIRTLCEEALQYSFATVCVNSCWTRTASELLKDSGVGVTTVIGFPLGAMATAAKVQETLGAIADGANEIDMVLNVGWLKSGDFAAVEQDIAAVAKACGDKAALKVILETGLLSDTEKRQACELSKRAGAHFVKTSTGFGKGSATVEDITLMRLTVGPELGVKASGGVRDFATARKMLEAGATRIGASAGIAIVTGAKASSEGY